MNWRGKAVMNLSPGIRLQPGIPLTQPATRSSGGTVRMAQPALPGEVIVKKGRHRLIIAVCTAGALFLQSGLYAQIPGSQPSFHAGNLWMSNPVQWNPAKDLVPGSARRARDRYFDQLIGYRTPLTPETAKGSGLSEGVPFPNQEEIPKLPDRSVLIATFLSYQPVLSRSGRAIYTEVTFLANNTFEDASGHATPGSTFVLIVPGGTVTTSSGVTLSFMTQPRLYSINIGRTYLLAMSYRATGEFFMVGQDWDVTDGVVRANFPPSSKTPATLIGLSLQQLTAKLDAQSIK